MDYVGSGWKQRIIERLLGVSGRLFYHGFLRPKEYLSQRKRDKKDFQKLGKQRA